MRPASVNTSLREVDRLSRRAERWVSRSEIRRVTTGGDMSRVRAAEAKPWQSTTRQKTCMLSRRFMERALDGAGWGSGAHVPGPQWAGWAQRSSPAQSRVERVAGV